MSQRFSSTDELPVLRKALQCGSVYRATSWPQSVIWDWDLASHRFAVASFSQGHSQPLAVVNSSNALGPTQLLHRCYLRRKISLRISTYHESAVGDVSKGERLPLMVGEDPVQFTVWEADDNWWACGVAGDTSLVLQQCRSEPLEQRLQLIRNPELLPFAEHGPER